MRPAAAVEKGEDAGEVTGREIPAEDAGGKGEGLMDWKGFPAGAR